MAECHALAFGAWVSAQIFPDRSIVLLSDCVAALGIAEASTGTPVTLRATQALLLLRRTSSNGDIRYQYTPRHREVFGNELVDVLAKAAAKGIGLRCTSLPHGCKWLSAGTKYLPWFATACISLRAKAPWPAFDGSPEGPLPSPSMPPEELLQPFLPVPLNRSSKGQQAPSRWQEDTPDAEGVHPFLRVKTASYNALSLAASQAAAADKLQGAGIALKIARPVLLARCLSAAEVDMASVQETRCSQGTLTTTNYFRICSGAEGGSFFGTEWWFRV